MNKDTTTEGILDRLRLAVHAKSDSDLARSLGITPQAISKARNMDKVPPSWCLTASGLFNISADWLFFGNGPMTLSEPPTSYLIPKPTTVMPTIGSNTVGVAEVGSIATSLRSAAEEIIMIPMVEAVLSAGGGSLETSNDSEKSYAFRQDFLLRKGNPKDMVLMRVGGDSMEPEIKDNDVVLLDTSKTYIIPGRIYAVGFEEAIYLKRIDIEPGKAILKSTNPAYLPMILDIGGDCEELFRVIGRVLWCGREYK